MKNVDFYVIKKSAGYAINKTSDERKARECAAHCCKVNNNDDFTIAVYQKGMFHEI